MEHFHGIVEGAPVERQACRTDGMPEALSDAETYDAWLLHDRWEINPPLPLSSSYPLVGATWEDKGPYGDELVANDRVIADEDGWFNRKFRYKAPVQTSSRSVTEGYTSVANDDDASDSTTARSHTSDKYSRKHIIGSIVLLIILGIVVIKVMDKHE